MEGLLTSELRAQLRGLVLRARRPPSAGPLGLNASRRRGPGLEFSQHRGYEPGDEPRRIDWKLFARSDRYFVRESESEAALTIWVLLDCSASMAEQDTKGNDKLSCAKQLAAAMLEIARRQNDRFGLVLIGDSSLQPVSLGGGPRHRDRCFAHLLAAQAKGAWPDRLALERLFGLIAHEAVVLMIGDGFEPTGDWLACSLAATGRDVRHIALSTDVEAEFSLHGSWRLIDPESGAELALDADASRADFIARFQAARREQMANLSSVGVLFDEHRIDQAGIGALRKVLQAGNR
ncbi:DUF58 domain-containing protein [Pseudomarimonas arenosa]|uniref:DUF58 domain-containing protein n=1 Tax=Pseudomarimonas arenosa TaxID=2774145 RepID=A0AAW3ZL07_9GAMM|nr:DUF58 domain-containing protein [Pseudomarimonas arenosa]MBD8525367.1 DUF58 domain-containing protein [Pseudomarimonas arenosa]